MNAIASQIHHGVASWLETIGGLFEAVGRRVTSWDNAHRRRREVADAAAKLRGLGERELRDIGLHRGIINGCVRGKWM
jgi:hypothetical protein